jgi:hypothetical protein
MDNGLNRRLFLREDQIYLLREARLDGEAPGQLSVRKRIKSSPARQQWHFSALQAIIWVRESIVVAVGTGPVEEESRTASASRCVGSQR